MIVFKGVSKAYAKSPVKAVDSLSLEIPDGRIFGFLGPNGAGKTTTIKMLTGALKADSGSIAIDGLEIESEALEAKRRFGYVSDNPEVFTKLKAYEFLNFVSDMYGLDNSLRKERIERYSSMFEIQDVLKSGIGSFSHGMKQKLFITASLLHDPQNWILDSQ